MFCPRAAHSPGSELRGGRGKKSRGSFPKSAVPPSRATVARGPPRTWPTTVMRIKRSKICKPPHASRSEPSVPKFTGQYASSHLNCSRWQRLEGLLSLSTTMTHTCARFGFMQSSCIPYLRVPSYLILRVPWGLFCKYRFLVLYSLRTGRWWVSLICRGVLFGWIAF